MKKQVFSNTNKHTTQYVYSDYSINWSKVEMLVVVNLLAFLCI
ncbi:hypothetical protein [Oceanobacillus caeni]|nr:hypothetical protein [Oceanobacillus caeni]